MTANLLVPAAEYVRMSTEHQQYSIANQSSAIQRYAESHGFEIVSTYTDAARSGLVLKTRPGLRQLVQDVVSGSATYKAILVYDVSRWGRFQDTDESAHYEFVCKSAGVPVHYCAETFANDSTLPSLIMKALKRTMAGEYSRELSVKVFDGHKRLALLGFKQGGSAGYGLRRLLVSPDGTPKQILNRGERKSVATDRVVLVHGPSDELEGVREIYRLFIRERRSMSFIARDLNRRGVKYIEGAKWNTQAVRLILTHPKYIGCQVYARSSTKLGSARVKLPRDRWVMRPEAFEPIIDQKTFEQAQKIRLDQTMHKTDEELLDGLRALLVAEGRLSRHIIERSYAVPSLSTYTHRFGSLKRAYELAGWRLTDYPACDARQRNRQMRDEVVRSLASMFPGEVSVVQDAPRCRTYLLFHDGLVVSVLASRAVRKEAGIRWVVDPVPGESQFITLLVRFVLSNDGIQDMYVVPTIDKVFRFILSQQDKWLSRGIRLSSLAEFCETVQRVRLANKHILGSAAKSTEPRWSCSSNRRLRNSVMQRHQ